MEPTDWRSALEYARAVIRADWPPHLTAEDSPMQAAAKTRGLALQRIEETILVFEARARALEGDALEEKSDMKRKQEVKPAAIQAGDRVYHGRRDLWAKVEHVDGFGRARLRYDWPWDPNAPSEDHNIEELETEQQLIVRMERTRRELTMGNSVEQTARRLLRHLGLRSNQASVVLDETTDPATLRVFIFDQNVRISDYNVTLWDGFGVSFEYSDIVRPFAVVRESEAKFSVGETVKIKGEEFEVLSIEEYRLVLRPMYSLTFRPD